MSLSLVSVSSSLALRLRASSHLPTGYLKVTSPLARANRSPSRSLWLPARRVSAAPRLFRRKILRSLSNGWKRLFFVSVIRHQEQLINHFEPSNILRYSCQLIIARHSVSKSYYLFSPWLNSDTFFYSIIFFFFFVRKLFLTSVCLI